MMEDKVRKRMSTYICMYVYVFDWLTLLYRRKLTKHCKPTIMEKIKIIKKKEIQSLEVGSWNLHVVVAEYLFDSDAY